MKKPTLVFLIGLLIGCAIVAVLSHNFIKNPLFPLTVFCGGLMITVWFFEKAFLTNPKSVLASGYQLSFFARQIVFFTGFIGGFIYMLLVT